MNYGFYDPPCNGKSGKFLEEERPLSDYPLSGTPPSLEVDISTHLYFIVSAKFITSTFKDNPLPHNLFFPPLV